MTFSIASSAASASGSERAAPPLSHCFYGIDEAGYGPNLGPLLITVTQWRTPGAALECDFYQLLRKAASATAVKSGRKLHVADSKEVFRGPGGFVNLETTALALLCCLRSPTECFQTIWQALAPSTHALDQDVRAPWYTGELGLPLQADPGRIERLAEQLQRCLEDAGVELLSIRSDLVVESRFNSLVEQAGSKGLVLSRLSLGLLRSLWSPASTARSVCVGDKHGGRNRYDELIAEILEDEMIFRVEEGRALSRYRVGETEFRFQVGGEQHWPVACASIISKYLRELAMELFNNFWRRHCSDIKPTRGYPVDAERFRAEIEETATRLQLAPHCYWRSR